MPRLVPARNRFLGSFPGELPPPDLPEVALVGRSNVGKSSAVNALLHHKTARVSRTPGRTQAIVLFNVDERLILADLPGYGYARVPEPVRLAWKNLVERYLGERPSLRVVVLLVDATLPAQPLDLELISGLYRAGVPLIVAATRADKLTKSARKPTLRSLAAGLGVADDALVPFSSVTREGVGELWKQLETYAFGGRAGSP